MTNHRSQLRLPSDHTNHRRALDPSVRIYRLARVELHEVDAVSVPIGEGGCRVADSLPTALVDLPALEADASVWQRQPREETVVVTLIGAGDPMVQDGDPVGTDRRSFASSLSSRSNETVHGAIRESGVSISPTEVPLTGGLKVQRNGKPVWPPQGPHCEELIRCCEAVSPPVSAMGEASQKALTIGMACQLSMAVPDPDCKQALTLVRKQIGDMDMTLPRACSSTIR